MFADLQKDKTAVLKIFIGKRIFTLGIPEIR